MGSPRPSNPVLVCKGKATGPGLLLIGPDARCWLWGVEGSAMPAAACRMLNCVDVLTSDRNGCRTGRPGGPAGHAGLAAAWSGPACVRRGVRRAGSSFGVSTARSRGDCAALPGSGCTCRGCELCPAGVSTAGWGAGCTAYPPAELKLPARGSAGNCFVNGCCRPQHADVGMWCAEATGMSSSSLKSSTTDASVTVSSPNTLSCVRACRQAGRQAGCNQSTASQHSMPCQQCLCRCESKQQENHSWH